MTQDEVPPTAPPLRVEGLSKSFGAVTAVEGVSFSVRQGQVLALVGDNGAGKSTLVKMIAGLYPPSSGSIYLHGDVVHFRDTLHARQCGIEVVYQDLALVEQQPIYMNLFLGRELRKPLTRNLNRRLMASQTLELLKELDIRISSPQAPVRQLSGGQRQGIAIARATHWATTLVLMDEPTAALGVAETAKVEELIQKLKKRGIAILLVSHNLDQVLRLSDEIAVLRRGRHVGNLKTDEVSRNQLVSTMTGLES